MTGAENMSERLRRNHSGAFEPGWLQGDRCEKTVAGITQRNDVHPNPLTEWPQLLERVTDVFGVAARPVQRRWT